MGESSIRDIVVDTDVMGSSVGRRNSASFGTTPEGTPDNIRVVYGINGCGKTVMLNTVHEIFKRGHRGRSVLLTRIAARGVNCSFRLVEDFSDNLHGHEKSLREEFEIYLSEVRKGWNELAHHNTFTMWHTDLENAGRWHQIALDGLPDEIKAGLRSLGDGRYDWAYLWDGPKMYLQRRSRSELRELLRECELSVVGLKQEFVDRLLNHGYRKPDNPLEQGTDEILVIDKATIQSKISRTVEFRTSEFVEPHRPPNFDLPVFEVLGEPVDPEHIFEDPRLVVSKRKELCRLGLLDSLVTGLTESRELTKAALKEKLKERGKKVSGNKMELQLRLEHCLRGEVSSRLLKQFWETPRGRTVPEYNVWTIQQQICFPGIDFDESTRLLFGMLPFTAKQIDSLIVSAEEAEDPEEIQLMLAKIESMKSARAKFYEVMGLFLPFSMSIDFPTFTESSEKWEELVWTINGFRVLNGIWEAVPREYPFSEKQFTKLSSVHLDVDRVSLAEGMVPSDRRKESARGLESKVDDFWAAYKTVILGHETHYRAIRKIFQTNNRNRRRLRKRSLHFTRFDDGYAEYDSPGYKWEEVMNDLNFLNTNPVQDKFTLHVERLRELFRDNVSESDDDDALQVEVNHQGTLSFMDFNKMIYRLIPAMNFLNQAHETTKLILANPEEESEEESAPFKRLTETYGRAHSEDLFADDLSSGEKHLFSMLLPIATASMLAMEVHIAEYLGMSPEHVLVLIDEPEISLHVNWQASLVDSVESALRANKGEGSPPVSIIFATHSPSILGNHIHRSTCLGPTEVFYEE